MPRATYVFKLFVAGYEPNSVLARRNLTAICAEHLKGHHRIAIVDVLKNTATALKFRVLVTPTLILVRPGPPVTLLGNLGETKDVLIALRLDGRAR